MNRSFHHFSMIQKMLYFAGLWHTQTHGQRLLRYYVLCFISLYRIFGQSCQLFASNLDLASAIRVLQFFMSSVSSSAMYYSCIYNYKSIKQIYSYILQDSQMIVDDVELNILQTYAHYGNLVTSICCIMICAYHAINITSSLFRMILSTNAIRSDLDLFPIISCFDYFSNRETYFYPIIIYQTITNFAILTASVACYASIFVLVCHACARLSIIKYKIYSQFIHNIHKDNALVTQMDLSPWIIDIIKSMIRTTEFMTLVNTVFERSYLFQTFIGFVLLTLNFLCIPVLIEHKTAWKDLSGFIIYIFGSFFVVYTYCYLGQKLINTSLDVYREVCLIPFWEISLKTQKLLLTTLTMSAKPYALSIGGIYVATHEFFGNFVRTSLSFAMVIHSIQNV